MPAAIPVTRHYASIPTGRYGARQVHYRRAGSGPCVLMLHQSPLSSADLLPIIEHWKHHYTCIAPDTPGYGMSDPFGVDSLEMDDIADGVVEFMDAVGIERCAVYGFHTGAMIAGALAHKYPERVVCAVANGYVVLTEAERRDFVAHYLPPLEPKWDGSHLTWLWARLREQTIFFPWHRPSLAGRMAIDVPSPETLTNTVVEVLRSGDHFRVGYRAAFTFRSDEALRTMRAPMLVTAAEVDPLHRQLPRIRHPSNSVEVRPGGSVQQTWELCRAYIDRHSPPPAPPLAKTRPLAGRTWNEMIDVPGGQVRVRRNTDAAGRTVLVQHDASSASDTVDAVAQSLVGHRPVLAIDLPGHGESDNVLFDAATVAAAARTLDEAMAGAKAGRPIGPEIASVVTVPRYVEGVRAVLDALGLDQVDFHGMWGGGFVGLELAKQQPSRVHRLVMSDVIWCDEAFLRHKRAQYTPRIEPVWYGGHLLMCWHLMRDQGLFYPWFDRTARAAIRREPHVEPAMVHGRVRNMLKAPEMWRLAYQAHFAYPVKTELPAARVPTLLCAPAWDPNYQQTVDAAAAAQRPFVDLPDEMSKWGPAFLRFLDARA
ncbi:MAG: alpha/beta fold hydrolase [Steroidobacteraceae bacterium]|jgi:pimeloyl-ACP methyl ester carboxylesterase|nr:alpha/beta fold hydrolase [Steroidobacteraceae bacterium]